MTTGGRIRGAAIAVVLFGAIVAAPAAADEPGPRGQPESSGRLMPPAALECPRDQLTSYTGRVAAIEIGPDSTTIEVHTDWDTTERVTIVHPGAPDARDRYRLGGEPYPRDGVVLTDPEAAIQRHARATAWVCRDAAVPPLVDWQAPME